MERETKIHRQVVEFIKNKPKKIQALKLEIRESGKLGKRKKIMKSLQIAKWDLKKEKTRSR